MWLFFLLPMSMWCVHMIACCSICKLQGFYVSSVFAYVRPVLRLWQSLTHSGWLASEKLQCEQVAMQLVCILWYFCKRLWHNHCVHTENIRKQWTMDNKCEKSVYSIYDIVWYNSCNFRNGLCGYYLTIALIKSSWDSRGKDWPLGLLPKPTCCNILYHSRSEIQWNIYRKHRQ